MLKGLFCCCALYFGRSVVKIAMKISFFERVQLLYRIDDFKGKKLEENEPWAYLVQLQTFLMRL